MIVVAEFYRIKEEHVPVNAGMLYMIAMHYKNEVVHFYAEIQHMEAIKKFWVSNKIEVGNIQFNTHNNKSSESGGIKTVITRITSELSAVRKIAKMLDSEQKAIAYFLSMSSVTSVIQKKFLFKKIPVIIVLHGDVEFIRLNNNYTRNFLGKCFRKAFSIKRELCKYIVLDEIIKENLIKDGFLNKEEIIAIPHPYPFKFPHCYPEYTAPFKFGHIGVASIEKQTHFLFLIAEKFKSEISKRRIEFSLIGRNENIDGKEFSKFISGIENKQLLSREDFESGVSQLHYSIFFYNEKYQLTGSGAVLDAFNFEKPIIALKSDLFVSIFSRAGNVGFLCNKMVEIEMIISEILSGKIQENDYLVMQANMRKFKKNNSLNAISDLLYAQLNEKANN